MKITARNLSHARRTGNPQPAFGTFPPLTIGANETSRRHSRYQSDDGADADDTGGPQHSGSAQSCAAFRQPSGEAWSSAVNVETIRFRYTPATGLFYGPPEAAQAIRKTAGWHLRFVPKTPSSIRMRLARRFHDRTDRTRRHL